MDLAGHTLLTLDWPLYFWEPDDVLFHGPTGDRPKDLAVRIEQLDAQLLLFSIAYSGHEVVGAVEMGDAEKFSIVSRGGQGKTGERGAPGMNGVCGGGGRGLPGTTAAPEAPEAREATCGCRWRAGPATAGRSSRCSRG